ncbi:cytochrome C oxidase subunit II [Janibacter indicus]|uniref:cytochrome-c oxidase n=1 Tax=Janibacter indicus TaxID=857417 RepID=A0A1L3MGA5_9MICO|nr:cytochrome c oxidase subunit II [Janibacter indicus]APH01246.1 cytochrome C oxidase subunit II [Janibacter indicus]
MPVSSSPSRRPRRAIGAIGLVIAVVALSACSAVGVHTDPKNGYLPEGVTEEAHLVENLWIWAWVAALAVGVLVWGLILWCMAAYRRRKDDDGSLPVQLQYNVPLEILYTVVPMLMVGALFYYTQDATTKLQDVSQEPDTTINIAAKQWSWDFNYVDDDVHEAGQMAELDGKEGAEEKLPTLYLPVGERVEFVLTSRDVIHSFWVPAFLEKMDVNPGMVNRFQVTPNQTGTFQGKCAELCGAYHSQMLFNVKVVERDEYDAHMQELEDKGQTGLLDNGLNREEILERDRDLLPEDDAARTSEEN